MERAGGTAERARRSHRRELAMVGVLVVLAAGLIAYLAGSGGGGSAGAGSTAASATNEAAPPGAQPATGPLGDVARRQEGDPLALGRTDAPVTMVMFSDYRCPFCARFSRETEQRLIDEYVADGRLRIEWRDFAMYGPESALAAQAGRAAGMQGRFWEFTRAIYADTPERTKPDLPLDVLIGYAEEVGVADLDRFRADMNSPAVQQAVQQDLLEGSALGIPGTPAFVVSGYPIMGAQPIEVFRARIDQALAAAP